ncbi:hypothetical protein B296_00050604, partial [Ensete ventricosum]
MQHANAVRTDGDATSPGMRSASRCGKKKKKKKTADEAKAIAITHMNALSWWSALPALPNKIVPKMLAAMSIISEAAMPTSPRERVPRYVHDRGASAYGRVRSLAVSVVMELLGEHEEADAATPMARGLLLSARSSSFLELAARRPS